MRTGLSCACLLLLLSAAAPAPAADDAGMEFFEKKVRPVLTEHCYKCHSAEAAKLKGGLLLDTRDGLRKGGESGPAVVPGKPEQSLLIKAVRYRDEALKMPPKGKLPDAVIADLEAWVTMGAPDPRGKATAGPAGIDFEAARRHWAYQPLRMPALPAVKHKDWPASPLDFFVLARLEANGLKPSPPADRRTLLRRVTFDLTGL